MSFRRSASIENIARHAKNTSYITKQITKDILIRTSNFSIFFSLFLANSKGKDKLLSLFQYFFQFLCACGKNSNIPEYAEAFKNKQLKDMVVYYNLKESISSARKVFRLFRFFDEIKGLTKVLKTDKPKLYKGLSVFTYGCSITYYISDNILWLLGILVRSKMVDRKQKINWKYRKNFTSFYRVIAYTLILLYSIYLQSKQNAQDTKYLKQQQRSVSQNVIAQQKAFKHILEGRRKIRFFMLQLALSILRFIMLTSSLRLKYHEKLDPVFVGVCGLASSVLGFMKALYEKKIIINIQNSGQRHHGALKMTMDRLRTISSIQASKFW